MRLPALIIACCSLLSLNFTAKAEEYKLTADSFRKEGVPQGSVTSFKWKGKAYPGTEHDCWVYVPKQYDASKPACVMVFLDGGGFVSEGGFRAPIVFDNLIHQKEMPVTIGVFVNPGVVPPSRPGALPRYNRSLEYDGLGDKYVRFLMEEILPEVGKKYNLTKDGNGRAICGASSGGICAFTAAWERPDQFSKVFSMIGSFTNLRGSQDYPSLIRKMEPKPIRVYLQEGSNDQDIYSGSWYISNLDMMWALRYARYDYKWTLGDRGHDGQQGAALLPDALRWLWRDYPNPVKTPSETPQPIMSALKAGEAWHAVSGDYQTATALASDGKGGVYFADNATHRLVRVSAEGALETIRERLGTVNALATAPDGSLVIAYADKRVAAYSADGKERTISKGIAVSDLTVNSKGEIFATETEGGNIWLLALSGKKRLLDSGVAGVNRLVLTPDQSLLITGQTALGGAALKGKANSPAVALSQVPMLTSYQVQPDGSLAYAQPYFDLSMPHEQGKHEAAGMATDVKGWLYVASNIGIQYCDQAGRVNGIIANPDFKPTTHVAFGGAKLDTLFAIAGGRAYWRKTQTKGALPFQAPTTPPHPRL